MRRHIPNMLTLGNLACGVLALYYTVEGAGQLAVCLMLCAVLLDFLDGFTARLLKAQSEVGKQLDSLADMVSFGLLPALFALAIFRESGLPLFMQLGILLIPLFSALRLARFNAAAPGQVFFSGLPTPAHALFWAGLYWQFVREGSIYGHQPEGWFLFAIMLAVALYMVLPLSMYSLKFTHFRLRENLMRYLLLLGSLVILLLMGLSGLPVVILFYMLISLFHLFLHSPGGQF